MDIINIHRNNAFLKQLCVIILATCLCNGTLAQKWIWSAELCYNMFQEQSIHYTGGGMNLQAHSFSAGYNIGGGMFAFSCQGEYTPIDLRNTKVQSTAKGSLHLMEICLGVRYYPIIPTIRIGTSVAIRFTAGVLMDVSSFYWRESQSWSPDPVKMHSPALVSPLIYGGFCFSPFRNTTGISIKLNYRPNEYSMQNFPLSNFTLKETFSLSFGLFIGSKIK